MNDLISRQAAVDAVSQGMCSGMYCDVIANLKNLPSAQPEQRWIPCSERLPDSNDFVLTINRVMQCGVYQYDGYVWLDYDGLYVNEGIIAWMPLPEPYTEETT